MRIPLHGLEAFAADCVERKGRASIMTLAVLVYVLRCGEDKPPGQTDIAEAVTGRRDPTAARASIKTLADLGYLEIVEPPTRIGQGVDSPRKVVRLTNWGLRRLGLRR